MPAETPAAPAPIDIASDANRRIGDFVQQAENLSLRPATGYYSTPFRGGLFGEVKAAEVAKRLTTRAVDVLWLGANPRVPRSLDYVVNARSEVGDFRGFERQVASGLFGSSRWAANGESRPDFNPLERPKSTWQVYRDVLEDIAHIDCVAMANLIPWGSRNMESFIVGLQEANRSLLHRVLEFADCLNAAIVHALRPELVVVPLSVARSRHLDAAWQFDLSLKQAADVRKHSIPLPEGVFRFYTGICKRDRRFVQTAFLRHPASLRVCSESRRRLVSEVSRILMDFRTAAC